MGSWNWDGDSSNYAIDAKKDCLNMDINSHITPVLIIVFGLLAIYIAFKVAHFVLKAVLHLIGLALLSVAVWWYFFR
jgi:hypothetical protein